MEFTFAELLRGYRERASLNQAALATALRIHVNTVSGWERSRCLPRNRELILRLADELSLAPAEVDQLLRAADFPVEHNTPAPLAARHQLRPPTADFVGREYETAQLVTTLQTTLARGNGAVISAVQGMGGVGKTELAYVVAHRLRSIFQDAQIVLDLRGSSAAPLTAEQALQSVLHAFAPDAPLPDDVPALERRYRAMLHGRSALILADDARDAAHVRALIPPAGCALLVTSRQRFTLPGMVSIHLGQLDPEMASSLLRSICDRLKVAEADSIARACGYLPLALRVSGSILHNNPALSIATYLRQLTDARQRLSRLRDPDDGQLDVETSLLLSYAQLDAVAQRVFCQLGVFVADFDTPLAVAVVDAANPAGVEEVLHRLLRRNLVMYDPHRARWRLHDLVRDMARLQLETAGELAATMWRYAHAVMQIGREAQEQYLASGEGVSLSLARFDAERPHIDTARHWAADQMGTPPGDTLLVADAIANYHIGDVRYDKRRERIPQLERALAAARRVGDRASEWQILNRLGNDHLHTGEPRQAIPYFEQCLSLVRALGERRGEGQALNNLGLVSSSLGEFRQAIAYYEQRLALAAQIGDLRGEGITLGNVGLAYADLGEYQRAIPYYEQALALAREIGNQRGESINLVNLGNAYLTLGDARRAIEMCELALSNTRSVGDRQNEAFALNYLGRAYAALGDVPRATRAFEEALATFREFGDRRGEAECSWQFGLFQAHQGERERALSLLRACVTYEEDISYAQAQEHLALLKRVEAGEAV